ncbi:MAG: DUF4153 domain-containing protein [Actinomycetota bacterium]|nr:DUF4153 domain-containing protein [Actinomycetota bacterium]
MVLYLVQETCDNIKACFIAIVVVYIALNFANVDVIIASNNIQRYKVTGQIDMEYLEHLSYDAIPEMEVLLEDEKLEDKVLSHFRQKKMELKDQDGWRDFSFFQDESIQCLPDSYLK